MRDQRKYFQRMKNVKEFRFLACVIIRAALGFFRLFICISVYNPISKGPVTSIKQRQRAQEQQHSKQKEMLAPRNPPLSFGAAPLSQQAAACQEGTHVACLQFSKLISFLVTLTSTKMTARGSSPSQGFTEEKLRLRKGKWLTGCHMSPPVPEPSLTHDLEFHNPVV